GDFIFTTTSGERPISGFSKAKAAIDKAITAARNEAGKKTLTEWHVHDIRRTMATWMADHGIPPHVLAAVINHSPGSTLGITAVYARSKWGREKRDALDRWAAYVVSLTKPAAKAATA